MPPKKVLITGATDGIGKQTALILAQKGYEVVVHGKNPDKGKQTLKALQQAVPKARLHYENTDLASLDEVKMLARRVARQHPDLGILINNAGVFETRYQQTPDGYERTFAINHLAPFALTLSLLPVLQAQPTARIINVASMVHQWGSLDFQNLNSEARFNGQTAYANSKLCNVLFTYYLAQRMPGESITANCLHPGVIQTKLLYAGWGSGGVSVAEGARTTVHLATVAESAQTTGKYYANQQVAISSEESYDEAVQKKLWDISLQFTQLSDPFSNM